MTVQLLTKSLIAGVAALTVISTVAITAAEAKDGCGKGFFYNGQRCVAKGNAGLRLIEPGFRPHHRNDRGVMLFGHRGESFGHRGDRGMSLGIGPNLRLHFGEGNRPRLGFSVPL
jgi:hypothetical protein